MKLMTLIHSQQYGNKMQSNPEKHLKIKNLFASLNDYYESLLNFFQSYKIFEIVNVQMCI